MNHPYPDGTAVRKINSVPGEDTHQDGAMAKILFCLGQVPDQATWGYFVEWDDLPGLPVFIASTRIEPVRNGN